MDEITYANWRARHVFSEGTKSEHVLTYTMPDGSKHQVMSIAHKPIWVWEVEIKTSDGPYVRPDCAYECDHCGKCLGCTRKLVFDSDALEFRQEYMRCENSPTGWHETTA